MDADFLLIRQMRAGNEDAVERFVVKYYPQILSYCRRHTDDYSYAEDLTQETFVQFFKTLNRYQHYGKAANYLYAIAANQCRGYYRKMKEIPMDALPDRPDPDTAHPDLKLDVRLALNGLPEDIREVAILYFLQEMKQKDIARTLEISLPLVKYRIRRARDLFSAYYEKEDV